MLVMIEIEYFKYLCFQQVRLLKYSEAKNHLWKHIVQQFLKSKVISKTLIKAINT